MPRGGEEEHCLHHTIGCRCRGRQQPSSFENWAATREGEDRHKWRHFLPKSQQIVSPHCRAWPQLYISILGERGMVSREARTLRFGKTGPFHLLSEAEKGTAKARR